MMLVKKILDKFNGLHYRQEYLCFAKESHTEPLHAYLVNDKHIIKDITNKHLFVGYSPMIFAFPCFPDLDLPISIRLIFTQTVLEPNEFFSEKDALASLNLKLVKKQPAGNDIIYYFEGVDGKHHFLSSFHQFINDKNNELFNKKPGNIFLNSNLYKQVQIAYAIPRIISLISIQLDNGFNLFPTDLNGQVDEEHYVISLRHSGKACEQLEKTGKAVISQINCCIYKTAFALGKNHMQDLKPKDNFPFSRLYSEKLQWPLPEHTTSYKELVLIDSFIHGIHKLLLFKIVFHQQLQSEPATLAHIHNSYASWRYKKNLSGNYLLR